MTKTKIRIFIISFILFVTIALVQFLFPDLLNQPITGKDKLEIYLSPYFSGEISLISNSKCPQKTTINERLNIDDSGIMNIENGDIFFDLLFAKQNYVAYKVYISKKEVPLIKERDIPKQSSLDIKYLIYTGTSSHMDFENNRETINCESFYFGTINQYLEYKDDYVSQKEHHERRYKVFKDCAF